MNADSSGELAAVVDDLLNQLNTKFTSISSELLSKSEQIMAALELYELMSVVDDMSRRLDNLEATIQSGDGEKSSGSGK